MTLAEFRDALTAALSRHFPQAGLTITESRGVFLTCQVKLGEATSISIYFHALTGKTSYALLHHHQRVAGYDNYRFWHYHPFNNPDRHESCPAPTPEEAIVQLAAVSQKLDIVS